MLKKFKNGNLLLFLGGLFWIVSPFWEKQHLDDVLVERIFLGIFALVFFIIEWKKGIASKRMLWMMTLILTFAMIVLTVDLLLKNHNDFATLFVGILLSSIYSIHKDYLKPDEDYETN